VLDYLPDLESDFSVFHRIDDIYSMHGPTFLALAYRISVYGGMIGFRRRAQDAPPEPPTVTAAPAPPADTPAVRPAAPPAGLVPVAAMALANPDLFEMVRVPQQPPE
jgi:hypothetical protein